MAPRLAAVSAVIEVLQPNEPLQGRLALTGGGPRWGWGGGGGGGGVVFLGVEG